MTSIQSLVQQARSLGASDLHLEADLPPTVRVNGALRPLEGVVQAADLAAEAARLLPGAAWEAFRERRSADLSRTIAGVRCRINVLYTARGVGFAIRLLHPFQATLESLNLHPELARLVQRPHGLVVVSGPTGSGKSSTIAALVEDLNRTRALHIVTLEQPIEHTFRPRRALIRQREVGRDTPSFQQGLVDALREDPDVLVVGEVRDPETIRLALAAAETGHLVITTLHAGSCVEALSRIVGSFPADAQPGVAASLAESLIGVVSQRLVHRADLGIRLPECEVLVANDAVRASVRAAALGRVPLAIQTGAADGMWTLDRWRRWQEGRDRHFVHGREPEREPLPEDPVSSPVIAAPPARPVPKAPVRARPAPPVDDDIPEIEEVYDDLASILTD